MRTCVIISETDRFWTLLAVLPDGSWEFGMRGLTKGDCLRSAWRDGFTHRLNWYTGAVRGIPKKYQGKTRRKP